MVIYENEDRLQRYIVEKALDYMDMRRERLQTFERRIERGRTLETIIIDDICIGDYNDYLSTYWDYLKEFDEKWN